MIIIFQYPQLILASHEDEKVRFLERLSSESDTSNVNVMVMNDKDKDSRINIIKYVTDEKQKEGYMYYSETRSNKKIITLNLGYSYNGPVLFKDSNLNNIAEIEHYSENILREKHIERISKLDNIKADLNPEETAEKYKSFFNNLKEYKEIKAQ
jgi:hypothetical protein